jgi:Nucleotide modification associated domain 3
VNDYVQHMRLILSRKGFDSALGGVASPIFPDTALTSLPIPLPDAPKTYAEIEKGPLGCLGPIVHDLTRGAITGATPAHLDPDLGRMALPRRPGWRPAFGQTGAAATHLARSGVGIGDVFLFFGWFRAVERGSESRWRHRPNAPNLHAVFGWLQIGEVIHVDRFGPAALLEDKPWLADHPHLFFGPDPRNVIYVAADRLTLPGLGDTGLPGAGEVDRFHPRLVLTCPDGTGRSTWRLPAWFAPAENRPALTYHGDPRRWTPTGEDTRLRVVGQGQEFVLNCRNRPLAAAWILHMLGR